MKLLTLAVFLTAGALEDPELSKSIRALLDEESGAERSEAQNLEVPKIKQPIHSQLVDPFADDAAAVGTPATEPAADPFEELEKRQLPQAVKMEESSKMLPKADPFAALATESLEAKHVAAQMMDETFAKADPFAEFAAKSVSQQVVKDETSPKADPFPEFAAKSVSQQVVKDESAHTTAPVAAPAVAMKPVKLVVERSNKSARALLKHVARHGANATTNVNKTSMVNRTQAEVHQVPVLASKMNENHNITRTSPGAPVVAAKLGFLHRKGPQELPATAHPKVQAPATSVSTATMTKTAESPTGARSLAAFWAGETLVAPGHTLMLVQDAATAVSKAKGIDFTQSDDTNPQEEEISISDPWRALEAEDELEERRLKNLQVKLRKRAKEKSSPGALEVEKKQTLVNVGTSGPWAKLEEEDQKIEDTILDLDDPRKPVDLRQYQQLNNLQDHSQAELQG